MKRVLLYYPTTETVDILSRMREEIEIIGQIDSSNNQKDDSILSMLADDEYDVIIVPYFEHKRYKELLLSQYGLSKTVTVYEFLVEGKKELVTNTYESEYEKLKTIKDKLYYSDKNVLILGGSSGIGEACARAFLSVGSKVLIAGRSTEKLRNTIEKLEEYEGRIYSLTWDITEFERNREKIFETERILENPIDIVINSAGATSDKSFFDYGIDEFDKIMDTNLKGMFFFSQEICKYWMEKKVEGSMVNILSIGGYKPSVNPYGLSKWGGIGFTEGLGHMMTEYGITVNGIAPGEVATSFIGYKEGDTLARRYSKTGRITLPEEVASLAVYLSGFMGTQMPGTIVKIAGGDDTIKLY